MLLIGAMTGYANSLNRGRLSEVLVSVEEEMVNLGTRPALQWTQMVIFTSQIGQMSEYKS